MPRRGSIITVLSSLLILVSCDLVPTPTPSVVLETVEVEVTRLVEITSTPEPSPSPTVPAPIVLQEDFEGGAGQWRVASTADGSAQVADGLLLVTVDQPNMTFSTGHPDLDFLDVPFDLTVALTNEAGPRDAYAGICFSYIDEANFAAIYVERDGFVSLASYVDGTYYAVIPWSRPTPILIPPYVVRLVDSGRRVLAYVNGNLLFDIPSEILGPGGVYFFAGTYDETPSTWGFDNIQLRQAPA